MERNIKDYDLDDFRQAMDYIVFKKDNDEIFNKNLNKQRQSAGRNSTSSNLKKDKS